VIPRDPLYVFSHDVDDVLLMAAMTRLSGETAGRNSHWKDGNSVQMQSVQVCSKKARKMALPFNFAIAIVSPFTARAVKRGAVPPTYGPLV